MLFRSRGHNEHGIGTWSDDALRSELRSLPFTNSIEYSIDSVHRSAALQSIANDPVRAFTRGIDKSLSLLLLDRRDERSFHPVYLLQTLVFLVLCAWGFIAFHRKKYSIPSEQRAYIIASLLTAAVFFCLPRYQTMFRIALLP